MALLFITAAVSKAATTVSDNWWQTILLGAVAGGIPAIIAFLLNRPANKAKVRLESEQVETNQFDVLTKAQAQILEERNAYVLELKGDISTLKQTGGLRKQYARTANLKLEKLHGLFARVRARAGIVLTPEESVELDATRPSPFDPDDPTLA